MGCCWEGEEDGGVAGIMGGDDAFRDDNGVAVIELIVGEDNAR